MAVLISAGALSAADIAMSADGDLDLTFGGAGTVTTDVSTREDRPQGVVLQADGKIVVAGHCQNVVSRTDFCVARYDGAGSLDPTFDGDGLVMTDFGGGAEEEAFGVAMDTGGRIILTGQCRIGFTGFAYDFCLARYNPDGTLDSDFDGDGRAMTDFGAGFDSARDVTVQQDGKIVAVGVCGSPSVFCLARYMHDGSLDLGFGVGGFVVTPGLENASVQSVAIQADGKILVAGTCGLSLSSDMCVARYRADGSLDPTFGGGGSTSTDIGGSHDIPEQVIALPDGKIVVAGYCLVGSFYEFCLARYNADGTLDVSFDDDGHVATSLATGDDVVRAAVVDPIGRIVVAGGCTNPPASHDFCVARYTTDGAFDTSFGGDGWVSTPVGSDQDIASGVALQPDGKIVVVGTCNSGSSSYNFCLARYGSAPPDTSPPVIVAAVSPSPNAFGWNKTDLTVTFTCTDVLSGVATCPGPVLVGTETSGQVVAGTATDNAGNSANASVTVKVDKTAPFISSATIASNPIPVGATVVLSAAVTDGLSGVETVEYFVGADPGTGSGAAASLSAGSASAALGPFAQAGVHEVGIRARDAAGNWSPTTALFLVVYDPTSGFATGAGLMTPGGSTSDPGDLLPGLDGTSKAHFGFTIKYQSGASTVPGGNLQFRYQAGSLRLASSAYDWLVVTNSNWARFRGLATIDGATGLYPFRVDARDGDDGGGNQPDRLVIRIWAPGANPDTTEPLYKASGDITGQIKIHR